MSYEYNSLGLKPSEMASYTMHRPSLYGNKISYRSRKQKPPKKYGLQALSLYDLKQLCFSKDPEAIKEYERRLFSGGL